MPDNVAALPAFNTASKSFTSVDMNSLCHAFLFAVWSAPFTFSIEPLVGHVPQCLCIIDNFFRPLAKIDFIVFLDFYESCLVGLV